MKLTKPKNHNHLLIETVYQNLLKIFYDLEVSNHYNYIPNTVEDGWDYYGQKFLETRLLIDMALFENKHIKNKLTKIIDESEIFVRSFSTPGVVKRWTKINPCITYFDVVFHIIDTSPHVYTDVLKRTNSCVGFDFYPDKDTMVKKEAYFKKINAANEHGNFRYSEDRIFQNELVKTLHMVFENDFTDEY